MTPIVEEVLEHWPALAAPVRVRPLTAGHIHDSHVVNDEFVLQRLNQAVFRNPAAVMRNLAKALAHTAGEFLVAPVPTAYGEPLAMDARGSFWRLFPFVPSRSFQNVPDDLLHVAAAAFGRFLSVFSDYSGSLEPVIDGFHDLEGYLKKLEESPKDNDVAEELRSVEQLRGTFAPGTVRSVIHGDCKVNNLLFHPSEPAVVGIIDLDTIMLGDPAWDFGDLARSVFAGGEESAPPAAFSATRFERLCAGFASAFHGIDDCARFAAAPAYMSFMLGVRFLTDHLQGDGYFKVAWRGQNLARARSQLDLAQRFRASAPELERALAKAATLS